jgi:hypothetical protein
MLLLPTQLNSMVRPPPIHDTLNRSILLPTHIRLQRDFPLQESLVHHFICLADHSHEKVFSVFENLHYVV